MNWTPILAMAAALALTASSPTLACPDTNSAKFPYFGHITLSGTYNPDPFKMTVLGGGSSALEDCGLEGEGLTGYKGDGISDVRPDVVLQWLGGGRRLAFTIENEADTLLVIHDRVGVAPSTMNRCVQSHSTSPERSSAWRGQ